MHAGRCVPSSPADATPGARLVFVFLPERDWAGFRGFCERIHGLFDGGQLFFPNYRMCPEITLLDQIEDVVTAYLYFSKRHRHTGSLTATGKPRRIVVVGDSCGGVCSL